MKSEEIIMMVFTILILITAPLMIWVKMKEDEEDNYIGTKKRKQ